MNNLNNPDYLRKRIKEIQSKIGQLKTNINDLEHELGTLNDSVFNSLGLYQEGGSNSDFIGLRNSKVECFSLPSFVTLTRIESTKMQTKGIANKKQKRYETKYHLEGDIVKIHFQAWVRLNKEQNVIKSMKISISDQSIEEQVQPLIKIAQSRKSLRAFMFGMQQYQQFIDKRDFVLSEIKNEFDNFGWLEFKKDVVNPITISISTNYQKLKQFKKQKVSFWWHLNWKYEWDCVGLGKERFGISFEFSEKCKNNDKESLIKRLKKIETIIELKGVKETLQKLIQLTII
ncbi:hypothetical protein M0813_11002 [Anaeramoeba flamelloides]|uniref:Uncharacterized protein n=1 Tax=Anaeramoeba flamelloides TaxID=1746091 RepID=A0ABQ8X1D5_9EUKA|nr:hypothetical protein M0813_11002 [Anaeramoeba flamelloides]